MKAIEVYRYLMDMGFYEPVVCSSGNGWHLLLPCKIGIFTETNDVVNKFLRVLSMLFSDESIDIDVKVGNPARICKLYGTMAKKGTNIPERPHRMARIVKTPEEIKPNNIEYFKKVAELFPEKEQPSVKNNWFPWFKYDKGVAGFVSTGTYYAPTDAAASFGSRLCFKTRERAEQFGKQFADLYNKVFL